MERSVNPVLEKSTSICSSGERSSSVSSLTSTSIDTPSDEGTERGKAYKPFSFPPAFQSLEDYIEETIQAQDNELQQPIIHLIQPDDDDDGDRLVRWKHREANTHVIERPLPVRGAYADYALVEHPYDCQQHGIYSCRSCLSTKDHCASCKLENRIQARGYSPMEKNFPPWPNIPYNSLLRNAPDIVLYERDLSQGDESFLPERFVLDWRKKLVQADIHRELNIHSNTTKENVKKKRILPKFSLSSKCKSMGQLPIVGRSDGAINTRKHQTIDLERGARSERGKKLKKSETEEVTWMQICKLMKESSIEQESDEIRKFLSRRPQMSVTQQTKLKVNVDSDKTKFKVQRHETKHVNSPKRKPHAPVKSGSGDRSRLQSLVFRDGSKNFTEGRKHEENSNQSKELKRQNRLDSYEKKSQFIVNPIISEANLASKIQSTEADTSGMKGSIPLIPVTGILPFKESVKATESEGKIQPPKILTVPKIMINETQRISIESPEVEQKFGPFNATEIGKSYRSEVKLILKSGQQEVEKEENSFQMDNHSSQDTEKFSLYSSLDDLDLCGSIRSTPSPHSSPAADYKRVTPCSSTISTDDVSSSLLSMRGPGFCPEKCLLSTIKDSERRLSASSSHSSTCRSLQTSPITVIEVNVSQETDSPISPPVPCDEIHLSSSGECMEESKQKLIDNFTETDDSSLPPIVSFAECDRLLDMLLQGNSKIAYIAEDKAVQCTLLQ